MTKPPDPSDDLEARAPRGARSDGAQSLAVAGLSAGAVLAVVERIQHELGDEPTIAAPFRVEATPPDHPRVEALAGGVEARWDRPDDGPIVPADARDDTVETLRDDPQVHADEVGDSGPSDGVVHASPASDLVVPHDATSTSVTPLAGAPPPSDGPDHGALEDGPDAAMPDTAEFDARHAIDQRLEAFGLDADAMGGHGGVFGGHAMSAFDLHAESPPEADPEPDPPGDPPEGGPTEQD